MLFDVLHDVCDPTIKGTSQSSSEGLTQLLLSCFLTVQGSAGCSFHSCTAFPKPPTSAAKRRLSSHPLPNLQKGTIYREPSAEQRGILASLLPSQWHAQSQCQSRECLREDTGMTRQPKQFHTESALQTVLSVPLACLYMLNAMQCTCFMFPSEVRVIVLFQWHGPGLDRPSLCYILVISQLISIRLVHMQSNSSAWI